MAREKATITVDREKLERVRRLTGAASASQAIDIALGELLRLDEVRRDVVRYSQQPQTLEEVALASTPPDWADLADDTDWDGLYAPDA